MHLSKEIQKRLNELDTNLKLATTIYGDYPEKYAFNESFTRRFSAKTITNINTFSLVIFERNERLKYDYCFARAIFTDLSRLVSVIDLWIDKEQDIKEIKNGFDELELFVDFDFKNSNIDIDEAWTKIKNIFFGKENFWEELEWQNKYLEMLRVAKQNKYFEYYFPYTSHFWLRFSSTKTIKTINLSDYFISACCDAN